VISERQDFVEDRTLSYSPAGDGNASSQEGHMPAVGETLAGRFLLRRILGTGGSGVVFAARDIRLNQAVAVKVLHPGLVDTHGLQRLRREVQAARGSHPHVASVYDLHEADGVFFLSMELVEGESLRDRLKHDPRLPVDQVVRIGAQIASALANLHGRGIVHRDVKPANILLSPTGDAKLCDMGLARPMAQGMTVTETAMVMGTPAYMAPEQATGRELTAAADVYGLGLTLYQALTGHVPLEDVTALSTLMRRQKERPPSVRREAPGTPRWLAHLLDRMLDPRPGERPTAATVERSLASGRFRFRPRRRTVAAGVALAVALVAVPAIYSQMRRGDTVRFEIRGDSIVGLDNRGRSTWTRHFGATPSTTVRADFDGDGVEELAVATRDAVDAGKVQEPPATVSILDLGGRVLMRARFRDIIGRWAYPFPLRLEPRLQAEDLDGDGHSELLAVCRQVHFFPSELLAYWPAHDRWQVVLEHPGYIRGVTVLPDPLRPRLRFAGVVNRPIYAPVAGEIVLKPEELAKSSLGNALRLMPGTRSVPGALFEWHTLLDPDEAGLMGDTARIRVEKDLGSSIMGSTRAILHLDRWGNPVPGPNAGRDLRDLRCRFITQLSRLENYSQSSTVASIRAVAGGLRKRFTPLLAERAYRIALDVQEARVLARAGGGVPAIDLLTATASETHDEDAVCLLANLLGIHHELRRAVAMLDPVVATPRTQRANFDGRLLLFHLAVELRDRPLAQRSLLKFGPGAQVIRFGESTVAAMLARAHLWWDEPGETDCRVISTSYEPAGDALACLARWRLGRTAPNDPERMREGLDRHPDAVADFRVAEAASQLGLSHPETAVVLLERLEPWLRTAAADDFANHQILDLARALRAKALLAAGHPAKARTQAQALLPMLTPDLLPANLAREVLDTQPGPEAAPNG